MTKTYAVTLTKVTDPTQVIRCNVAEDPKTGAPMIRLGSAENEAVKSGQTEHVRIEDQSGGSGQKVARDPKKYQLANGWLTNREGLLIPRGEAVDTTVSVVAAEVAAAVRRGAIFSVADQPYTVITPAQVYEGLAPIAKKAPPTATDVFTGSHARFGSRTFFGAEDSSTAEGGLAAVRRSTGSNAVFSTFTFTKSTTVGTTTQAAVSHGLSVVPKAIIFFSAGKTVSGTISAGFIQMMGFSDGTRAGCQSSSGLDGDVAFKSAQYNSITEALAFANANGSTTPPTGIPVNIGGTTFDINWTANDANAYIIHGIAIGGSDVSAFVKNWTAVASGLSSQTGVGFKPDALLNVTGTALAAGYATNGNFSLSAADSLGNNWSSLIASMNGGSGGNSQTWHQGSTGIRTVNGLGVQQTAANFASLDADGFAYTFLATSVLCKISTLCLKGIRVKAKRDTAKPTGAAPATDAQTGVGFTPTALLMASVQATTAVGPQARIGIGAASSAAVANSLAVTDTSPLAQSSAKGLDSNQASAVLFTKINNDTMTKDAVATLTSFDADGFTLSWNPNDAVATVYNYIAFAPLLNGGGGTYASSTVKANYFARVGARLFRLRYDSTAELWYESWTDVLTSDSPGFSTEYPVTSGRRSTGDLVALGPVAMAGISGVDQTAEFMTIDTEGNFTNVVPEGVGVTNIVAAGPWLDGQVFLLSGTPLALWFRSALGLVPFAIRPSPPDDTLNAAVQNNLGGVSGLGEVLWLASNNQILYGTLTGGWSVNLLETFDSSYSILALRAWPSANQVKVDVLLRTAAAITIRTYTIYNGIAFPAVDSNTKTFTTSIVPDVNWRHAPNFVSMKFERISGYATVKTGTCAVNVIVEGATIAAGTISATGPFSFDLPTTALGRGIQAQFVCTNFMGVIELPLEAHYWFNPSRTDIVRIPILVGADQITRGGTIEKVDKRDGEKLISDAVDGAANASPVAWTMKWWDGRADWTVIPIGLGGQYTEPESRPGNDQEVLWLTVQRVG